MSGNRANAAARNRRAGGGPEMQAPIPGRGGMVPGRGMPVPGRGMAPPPQQMQQMQQMKQQMQQMQQRQAQQQQMPQMQQRQAQQQQTPAPAPGVPGPKQMTVQNAVTLMSIRLGRLETFMQKVEGEGEGTTNENSRIVDDGVFNSMIARLDALERGHKLLSSAKPQEVVNNEVTNQLSAAFSTLQSEVSELKPEVSNVKSEVSVLKSEVSNVKSEVSVLKSEVSELKEVLLSVQNFAMQTNEKLMELVFYQEQQQDINTDENQDQNQDQDQNQNQNQDQNQDQNEGQEKEDLTNDVILPSDDQDFAGQDLTGSLNVNLKELVQQELSNTDISEIVAEQ